VVDFLATDEHGFTRMSERETNSSILPNPCLKLVRRLPRSPLPIAALPSMSLIPFAPFIRVNPWLESLFASRAATRISFTRLALFEIVVSALSPPGVPNPAPRPLPAVVRAQARNRCLCFSRTEIAGCPLTHAPGMVGK
jgi:hypothetical protein